MSDTGVLLDVVSAGDERDIGCEGGAIRESGDSNNGCGAANCESGCDVGFVGSGSGSGFDGRKPSATMMSSR